MTHSSDCFLQAQEILVGGVNSPVRAFKAVGGHPIFFKQAKGPYLRSEESQDYIDYVLSWGPMILGHADEDVVVAVQQAVANGLSFGAPSVLETQLARLVQSFVPSIQKLRFVNSGTEATMSAIRLARGATKRKLIVKFNGCYHGHVDSLLVAAGSGALTFGKPDSEGILDDVAKHTVVLEYNDRAGVGDFFRFKGDQVAAVIVEPVCGNMGVVLPQDGFLATLRQLCTRYQALLIFDEVMTGFRVHPGGAQALYGIEPDLTCLGKVLGGGMPCAAYGGKASVMDHIAPIGGVYQAGTLSGNPVAMAAGIATLNKYRDTHAFEKAARATQTICEAVQDHLSHHHIEAHIQYCGTMFTLFFSKGPIVHLPSAKKSDEKRFSVFFHHMLEQGIYMAPSQFESNFLSSMHTEKEISRTIKAFEKSLSF